MDKTDGRAEETRCFGGLGKRTDHTLSNLIIAGRVNPSIEVIFDDVHEHVSRVTPETPFNLKGRSGANLSILPLCECKGVQSSGLEWELDNINFSWDRDDKPKAIAAYLMMLELLVRVVCFTLLF